MRLRCYCHPGGIRLRPDLIILDYCLELDYWGYSDNYELGCYTQFVEVLCFIYSHNFVVQREDLWFDLNHISNNMTKPWIFTNDFNVVLPKGESSLGFLLNRMKWKL